MRLTRVARQWKEAATLMMVAKKRPLHVDPNTHSTTVNNNCSKYNYRLLMLERSSKSKFMPSAYVFPGGGISTSDYSSDWLDIYKDCGVPDVNSSLPVPPQDGGLRAPMFTVERDWPLKSDLAFRICSIRETFEEAGILICKHKETIASGRSDSWKALDKRKLQDWRPLIQKDDRAFLDMCIHFSVVPDVWSLYEWNCWLTPNHMPNMHHGKRYDTAFYICCLPSDIDAVSDQQEIVHSKWVSVPEVLSGFASEKLWLAPPQIYELSRLGNVDSFYVLRDYIQERHNHGCPRWLPVRTTFTDGIAAVLPGDDLYPGDPDIDGEHPAPVVDKTLSESLAQSTNIHRFEMRSFYDVKLHSNILQENNHHPPSPLDQIIN